MINWSKDDLNTDNVVAMATNNPFLGDVMYGAGGGAVQQQQGAGDQGQYYGRGYTQVSHHSLINAHLILINYPPRPSQDTPAQD